MLFVSFIFIVISSRVAGEYLTFENISENVLWFYKGRVGGFDESCIVSEDCYENNKKCDGIKDVGCICEEGRCKKSSK